MISKFITDYIYDCLKEGIHHTDDIKKKAQAEIDSLEEEIKLISLKKERVRSLRAVIKNFCGGDAERDDDVMDFSTPEENLSPSFKKLCINICEQIADKPSGVNASTIIHDLVIASEHSSGYAAIQWLSNREIIEKSPDRKLIIGRKWEDRPNG